MADNVEVVQTNITIETNEAENLVEFRYYGVNEAALAALIPRVWALEDFQDQLEADLNAALAAGTGPIQIQLDALDAVVDAEILASNAEEAARIAGDQALGADILALDNYLTPLVLAEPGNRTAAIAVETAARTAAISAATGPIIANHNALAATVAGQTALINALDASLVGVNANIAALDADFVLLSAEFATWSSDFTTVENAVIAETGARVAADNAIHTRIDGLTWKPPVRVATTAAGTLATNFENGDVIDGVTLVTGDRILIKDQGAGAENGIYVVSISGAPLRAADMSVSSEVLGAVVLVTEGTANGDALYFCSTNAPVTLDTTTLVFTQISNTSGPTNFDSILTASGEVLVDDDGNVLSE